jgi:chromate transporter
MATAFILLVKPFGGNWVAYGLMTGTFALLHFTKIKTPVVIIIGVLLGIFF